MSFLSVSNHSVWARHKMLYIRVDFAVHLVRVMQQCRSQGKSLCSHCLVSSRHPLYYLTLRPVVDSPFVRELLISHPLKALPTLFTYPWIGLSAIYCFWFIIFYNVTPLHAPRLNRLGLQPLCLWSWLYHRPYNMKTCFTFEEKSAILILGGTLATSTRGI